MHFKPAELINYAHKYFTLQEGDLILTGTPSGVGLVKDGDLLEGTVYQTGEAIGGFKFKVKMDFSAKF